MYDKSTIIIEYIDQSASKLEFINGKIFNKKNEIIKRPKENRPLSFLIFLYFSNLERINVGIRAIKTETQRISRLAQTFNKKPLPIAKNDSVLNISVKNTKNKPKNVENKPKSNFFVDFSKLLTLLF